MSRWFPAIAEEYLPQGEGLSQDAWGYRHRLFVLILWGHAVGLVFFGWMIGASVPELCAAGLSVGGVALLAGAGSLSRRASSVFVGVGLVLSSSLLVHFSGGHIEAHFHYFVVVFLLMLYQDWIPFLAATVLVILHHGVVGSLFPQSVYNHPDALAHPWKWSAIHGLFFGAAAVICIAIWRVLEGVAKEQYRSANLLDAILDRMPILVFAKEAQELRHVRFNKACEELLGVSRAAVLGKSNHELFPEELAERYTASDREALDQGMVLVEEEPITTREKGARFLRTKKFVVGGDDGSPKYLVGISEDITDRKAASEVLEKQESNLRRFKHMLDRTQDCIFTFRPDDYRFTYVNEGAKAQVGYSEAELLQMTPLDIKPELTREQFDRLIEPLVNRQKESVIFQAVHRHKDGHDIPVEISLQLLDLDEGERRFLAIVRDVSFRKQAEAALAESEVRFRQAVEFAPNGILMVNADGMITMVNRQVEALFGYQTDELVDQPLTILVPQQFRGGHEADMRRFFSARAARAMGRGRDLFGVRKDGTEFPVEIGLTPLETSMGPQVLASIIDITERKEADRALIERQTLLDAANKELEAFAYSVSHDLRAPLRGINGFCQALLDEYHDKLDPQGQDYLRRVRKASDRMGRLIDDLLGLSRATRKEFVREVVNLSQVAVEVNEDLRKSHQDRQVNVVIVPGLLVSGDQGLLRIVLENLLGNAWKFTAKQPSARIEFGITVNQDGPVYYVRDNGTGFDMAYVDKLFAPFQRLHGMNEFPGTGIGLATVSRIVGRHGGRVWAQGVVGQGAMISFTLQGHGAGH